MSAVPAPSPAVARSSVDKPHQIPDARYLERAAGAMSLYDRLQGVPEGTISVHKFMAALGELERGKMTAQQVIDAFTLDAGEQAELTTLISRIVTPLQSISMGGFTLCTNIGAAYDTVAAAVGLGFVPVERAGITAFEFRVGMNRNASTGTISWQLWNETDSAEVAVLTDTTGTGNKFVQTVVNFDPPLTSGVKVIRVRGKSTVAADDPQYFGASLLIRRVGVMTSEVLHEVLLLQEQPAVAPYTTVAATKTRLGV